MKRKIKSQDLKSRNKVFVCLILFVLIAGCQEKTKSPSTSPHKGITGTKPTTQSESTIKQENEKLKAENKQLKQQLEKLMGIEKTVRLDALAVVSSIEITDRSGIYAKKIDVNNIPQNKKMLIVYLRPIDDMGDYIKAAGSVKVELWNLDTKPADALLASWYVEPEDLKKLWSGSLFTGYYKLQFDVDRLADKLKDQLTLKIEFTDYLTGKTFKEQKVIKYSPEK